MSVAVNVFQTVEVPDKGAYLANVVGEQLYIYPQGLGRGPVIAMSKADWSRIMLEVKSAFARADRQGGV